VILRLFNGKQFILQFAIILAFLALMINYDVALSAPKNSGPLYTLIYHWLERSVYTSRISFFALLISEALLLQLIVAQYRLVPRNNYIIIFIWFLLSFSNPSLLSINPVIIASVITSWGLFRLLSISELEHTLPNLFTAGFMFSSASLVYGNMIWYIVFRIIGLMVLSLFRGRELMVSLVSFALPYVFILSYGFVFNQEFAFGNPVMVNFESWSFFSKGIQLWLSIIIFIIIVLLSLYSVFNVMLHLSSKLIQIRKSTTLLFVLLIFNILLLFTSGTWWSSHPFLIFIPLSILLTLFLSEQKKSFYIDLILLSIIILEIVQLYYAHYAKALS